MMNFVSQSWPMRLTHWHCSKLPLVPRPQHGSAGHLAMHFPSGAPHAAMPLFQAHAQLSPLLLTKHAGTGVMPPAPLLAADAVALELAVAVLVPFVSTLEVVELLHATANPTATNSWRMRLG
jgi:hypothetical protein